VDQLHGLSVADPYRWLEDAYSADTKAWVDDQNALTMPYLAALPGRAAIRERLGTIANYERHTNVSKRGDRYFWFRNSGLQNRSVLYTSRTAEHSGEVLIDPNAFEDTTVSLSNAYVSPNGKLIAYVLQKAGSDWKEVAFMNVENKQMLADRLKWIKFSTPAWSEDSKGVYYSRYDEPKESEKLQQVLEDQKVFYHKLGTTQGDDEQLVLPFAGKRMMLSVFETEDGRYLVANAVATETRKASWYCRRIDDGEWMKIVADLDLDDDLVGTEGDRFFILTTEKAPKGKLIEIDVSKDTSAAHWKTLIPESDVLLETVDYIGGKFLATVRRDARIEMELFHVSGKPAGKVGLPGIGTVSAVQARQSDTECFFMFTGYTAAASPYRLDIKTGKTTIFKEARVPVDLNRFETTQVFYNSKDGTRIPMFLTHRKGLKLDGANPVMLRGYGGFNSPVTPAFTPQGAVWLEMGGILADPALRGGGEYGSEWHRTGTKARKQNVFDDFIAAAEFLIAKKYTNAKKIAISGASNGGLLVAACLLQRPDLFGVALPAVGVLDMLRFHKFTIGWAWVSDYGSPDNPEDFKYLLAYSPLHNVKKGVQYPATLITTADHDDRVVPAHSFKFASALQAAQEGNAPILVRVQTKAGHGAGKPLSMSLDESADLYAFTAYHLGLSVHR
jgi:prolyl oligopeptidase